MTFSSGSTGAPKGVLVSHRNRTLASCLGAQAFELADDDVMACTTPLFHVAGLFMWLQIGIRRGLTVVLLEKWAPDLFADAIQRDGATAAFLVPSQVTALLDDPAAAARVRQDGGGLRHLNVSGAPMPSGLLERALDAWPGLEIVEHYGQSESCPLAYRPAAFARLKPMSAGRPCVEMAVLDGAGRPLPQGEAGEVASRGAHTLLGYIGEDIGGGAGLADLQAGDGWLRTGDIGRIDEDGFLHLIDRSKDVIVSGGENIFPAEVERALYLHPAVRECAVFGVPDDKWGEVPAAHVVPNGADMPGEGAPDETGPPDEAALIDFVAGPDPALQAPRASSNSSTPCPAPPSARSRRTGYGRNTGRGGSGRFEGCAGSSAYTARHNPLRRRQHRHMARLRGDAGEPGGDGRIAGQVEAAFVGDVGVGVEGDVGDRHGIAAEPVRAAEMPLHHRERGMAALLLRRQLGALQVGHVRMLDPVARDGDVGLVAVLLEEQPLQGQRPVEPPGRQEARALGQIAQDRVGFGEAGAVLQHQ